MVFRFKSIVKDTFLVFLGLLLGLFVAHIAFSSSPSSSSPSVREVNVNCLHNNKVVRQASEIDQLPSQDTNQGSSPPFIEIKDKQQFTSPSPVSSYRHHGRKKIKRPKYLKDEFHIREPLYVGVVTAANFLDTRALAVNNTWAKYASKVEFFAAAHGSSSSLPVVSLPDVDDTYPPQKKVYRMLSYLHDNYINDYNWFVRADDDAYVRIPELVKFLSQLDPSEPIYVGSPGFGRKNDLERIKLHPHEHYCMGGPGVVFSRGLLIKLVPHLEDCLKNVVVSWNEDLEVGRCISRRLGIQCTWAHEMTKLFYMDYTKGEMFKDAAIYRDQTVASVLTMHPFKSPSMMYRIHQFFTEIKLRNLDRKKRETVKELEHVRTITQHVRAFP